MKLESNKHAYNKSMPTLIHEPLKGVEINKHQSKYIPSSYQLHIFSWLVPHRILVFHRIKSNHVFFIPKQSTATKKKAFKLRFSVFFFFLYPWFKAFIKWHLFTSGCTVEPDRSLPCLSGEVNLKLNTSVNAGDTLVLILLSKLRTRTRIFLSN
jgi:hypothetical protein